MAKKSNKTEHVLKLITKNDETTGDDDFFSMEEGISDNGTSAVKSAIQIKAKEEPKEDERNLSVKSASEKELKYETKLKIEIEPEIELKKPEPAAEIPVTREEPAAKIPAVREESAAESRPVKEELPQEPQKEPPTIRAFREQEKADSVIPEQSDDLVNIAEILAREKLGLVMERMKVCTCKTCVNDVLALALNSLPTKYVTTDSGKQYFQLDIYKKQYETDILAALTKACVRVKASPRH
jgi:competence protein ComFB